VDAVLARWYPDPMRSTATPDAGGIPALWSLDPRVTFLNHGAFGARLTAVLEAQQRLRERLERQPVRFFIRDLEPLVDAARAELARFVGADPHDLVFVPNATAGVNTVLRSLTFEPGDELLTTDHEYNACRNALEATAARTGARVVVAAVPLPVTSPDEVVNAVVARAGVRTRLALLDHVTSQTGMVLPIARLVAALNERGIDTLVDGAHAPGMLPLSLQAIGAAYYTGNCHKWICAPISAALLHVRRDRQALIRPLSISHGANSPRADRSRFLLEFDWTGTGDPTAYLCVPEAIRAMGALLPGGWPALMADNHEKALAGRATLCAALGAAPLCPDEMVGSLAVVALPDSRNRPPQSPLYTDALQDTLLERFGIEVPIVPWPAWPKRLVRISAQLYNTREQYASLAAALIELIQEEQRTSG
jgi:isopenicillin-N epimerase